MSHYFSFFKSGLSDKYVKLKDRGSTTLFYVAHDGLKDMITFAWAKEKIMREKPVLLF